MFRNTPAYLLAAVLCSAPIISAAQARSSAPAAPATDPAQAAADTVATATALMEAEDKANSKTRKSATALPDHAQQASEAAFEAERRAAADATQNRWIYLAFRGAQSYELDEDSIEGTGSIIQAWIRKSGARPFAEGNHLSVSKHLSHWQYNCAKRQASLLRWVIYDEAGDVVEDEHVTDIPEAVAPESLGEKALTEACSAHRRQKS